MSGSGRHAGRSSTTVLVVVCLALFVDMLLYSVVVPVLPGYSRDLGASDFAIGVLFAAYAVGLLVASPPAGAISDRIGRRLPMVAGSLGIAVATAVFAYGDSYSLLLTARLLQGVSAAAVWTAGVALIADVVAPKRAGAAMGTAMASSSTGLIFGPPLGGLLTAGFGHRAPFLVTAAFAALFCLLIILVLPAGVARRPRPTGLLRMLSQPPVLLVFLAVALGSGALSFLEPTLPLDLTGRLGADVAAIGIAFGVATLVHAGASVAAGYLTAVEYAVQSGVALVAMSIVLPTLVLPGSLIPIVVLLGVFAAALAFVLVPAMPALTREADRLGLGYGGAFALFNAAYAAGMLIGPISGGGALGVAPARTVYAGAGIAVAVSGLLILAGAASRRSRRSFRERTNRAEFSSSALRE
jgi:multidrug resistance protein